MALPKRRHSHGRGARRRAHDALKPIQISVCPRCSHVNQPHRVCGNCGYYKGRQVIAKETA